MSLKNISLDQYFRIESPVLHDSEILGWELSGKNLQVKLKTVNDTKIQFIFEGIKYLEGTNFSTQNVVADVDVLDIQKMSLQQFSEKTTAYDFEVHDIKTFFAYVQKSLLIYFRPSVGAEIKLICDSISWQLEK